MAKQSGDPLTNRLEEVLSSPVKIKIARLLTNLPDKEFTGREIARLLGVSHSSIQEAMRVFVESGLAVRSSVGRAHLYRTNRESYLFSTLQYMFRKDHQVRDDLLRELREAFGKEAVSIILFGSYARGTANSKSDMDVLVVSLDVDSSADIAHKLETRFLRTYGLRLSAKLLTPAELRRQRNAPFIKAARKEGLVIAGRPVDEVIRSGG